MATYIKKLVCLGDSLTQAYNISENKCWVMMASKSNQFDLINAGISGDTTAGMLARAEHLILLQQPSHMIITGGTNDVSFNVPINIILYNIHAITRLCKYYDVVPIIGIPLSIYSDGFDLEENQFISNSKFIKHMIDYQTALREFSIFNDFIMVDFGANTSADHMMEDGVHPNIEGHQKMASILLNTLDLLIR